MNQKYFKIILGIVILILVIAGIYYFTSNRKIDNKTRFATKAACESKTGMMCAQVLCDYVPEGKTYKDVCPYGQGYFEASNTTLADYNRQINEQAQRNSTSTQPNTQTPPINKTVNWKTDAVNTVSVFTKNINTAGYGDNINIALAQLTANAQAKVKADSPDTTLTGLASGFSRFVHVQEAPDNGTSIISSEKLNDSTVKVVSKWNYSNGSSITQTFILVFENNQWKIDKVETTTTQAQNPNIKIYSNSQYSFEFQYPYKNLSVAEGYVSSIDPQGLEYVINLFTIPHGQDRDGLVGVFNLSLNQTLQSLGFAGQTLPTVTYNGVIWTKLPRQDTPSDYLVEKNGKTFWVAYTKQADLSTIITSFKFNK